MLSYIFSKILNLMISCCFILFVFSLLGFIGLNIKHFLGKKIIKDDNQSEKPIEEKINSYKMSTVRLFGITLMLYLLNYGFTPPTQMSEVMKEKGAVADQELKEIEAEKLAKEQKKAAEKAEKERKEAEEKAEKERKKQEKLSAERQAKIDAENADKNNHDFIEISAETLMNELESNAARANKNFNGKYIKITNAVITNIESDGDYINVDYADRLSLHTIQCEPKYSSTKEQIFNLNKGQRITVYGKVRDVGEIIGYYLELLKME